LNVRPLLNEMIWRVMLKHALQVTDWTSGKKSGLG